MHRDTDTLFALLLLVTGHIALMERVGLGWFELLLLDVWLVPLWFRKHPNCCASKEQQSEAHEREGYPLENLDPGNAAADIEKSATDHDEFESARVDERLQKKLHDPVSIGCVATPMIAAAGSGVHRPGPAAVRPSKQGKRSAAVALTGGVAE